MPATEIVEGLKSFADDARATQIVVDKSARSRWFELRHGSVVDRLVRETPGVAVHVLPLESTSTKPGGQARPAADWGRLSGYGWSLAMVTGVTAVGLALFNILALGNVVLLYMLPVMAAASLFGLRTGLFGGLASSLAYNFFFLPPTGTLTVADPENVVSTIVLLGVP